MEKRTDHTVGLNPQEHEDLNTPSRVYPGGEGARKKRMAKLRFVYANDPLALQQIDVYDNDSGYQKIIDSIIKAYRDGDLNKADELEALIKSLHPDIQKVK